MGNRLKNLLKKTSKIIMDYAKFFHKNVTSNISAKAIDKFWNLKIFHKFIVILVIVVFIFGINTIFSISAVYNENNFINYIYKDIYTPNSLLTGISINIKETEALVRDHLAKSTLTEKKQIEQKIQTKIDETNTSIKELSKQNLDKSSKILFKTIETKFPQYAETSKIILQLSTERKETEAYSTLYGDSISLSNSLSKNINELVSQNVTKVATINKESSSNFLKFLFLLIILFALTISIMFFMFFFVAKQLSRQINRLVTEMKKAEIGDVDISIDINTKDEIGYLATSLKAVADNIIEQASIAERISNGDLSTDVKIRSDKDIMSISMRKIINTLKDLEVETEVLISSSLHGYIQTRGKTDSIQGGFKRIIEGFNETLDIFVGFINTIPSPILIMDTNFKITYANDACFAFAGMGAEKLLGSKYTDVFSNFKTTDFSCALAIASENKVKQEVEAEVNGKGYELIDFSIPLFGDGKIIGCFELITDQTDIKKATKKMEKIFNYQALEVQKLTDSLVNLSQGNLDISLFAEKGDSDTEDIYEVFDKLSSSVNIMSSDLKNIISEISSVLADISNKNLAVAFNSNYKGDFANISNSIYTILESLNVVLGDINTASNQVGVGSNQVANVSQNLAQGATEQASVIEELTASLYDISAQTKENAVNSGQANQLVIVTKNEVIDGTKQMHEMVNYMDEISKVSSKISKVISFIDEIAFQTNILALNASVEAARVGQYGNGFAVVAQEVKKLANKSADAAKETSEMIESSIDKINHGTKMAIDMAKSLDSVADKIEKVASIVSDISIASNSQATSIAQIKTGIDQVSNVVQTNSATSEESAASSHELSSQAKLLMNLSNQFKLNIDKNI